MSGRQRGPQARRAVAWLVLLAASVTLHLWGLGERSFHHDEAIHAKLSLDLAERGAYRYDPTYHGPLLYYATAATFVVLGDTDFTARLPTAVAGIAMLWVAWRLRRLLGGRAAWWTGVLFTISPLFLYYGRFLRMDLLEALTASAALLSLERAVRGRDRAWVWVGVWAGLAYATKENAYVTTAVAAASAALVGWWWAVRGAAAASTAMAPPSSRRDRWTAGAAAAVRAPVTVAVWSWRWLRRSVTGVLTAAAVFVLVTVPLYTVLFTYPRDWLFPVRAIAYWWGQHEVQRVGGPWWFHLPRLLEYEFLVLACAVVWVARRRRRLRVVEAFLFALGGCSIAMYAYLGEKVPWLGVHQVWPLIPLAGAQLGRTFGPAGRWWSRGLAGIGLAATVAASLSASFVLEEISPRDRRVESLHFVQTTPEMAAVAREGASLEPEADGATTLAVSGEAAWPLNWYWRQASVWWGRPPAAARPRMVVCDLDEERDVRRAIGPGYERQRVPLRAWWLMEVGDPGPWDMVRHLVARRYWGSIGSTDVVVLRRTGGREQPAMREVETEETLRHGLGVTSTRVVAEGRLEEARGVAVAGDRVAVADPLQSRVVVVDARSGEARTEERLGELNQPEAVAWGPDGSLWVADTWNHRVLRLPPEDGAAVEAAVPTGGWYGPRALDLDAGGRLVVADTGNRRLVVYAPSGAIEAVHGDDPGEEGLLEPVGVAWTDRGSILVCDTGHRRVVELDESGTLRAEVALPGAWSDFYSRPQIAVLGPSRWLLSDTPAAALWLVDGGEVLQLSVDAGEMVPTGLAWDAAGGRLLVGDLWGKVWLMEVADE